MILPAANYQAQTPRWSKSRLPPDFAVKAILREHLKISPALHPPNIARFHGTLNEGQKSKFGEIQKDIDFISLVEKLVFINFIREISNYV